jgi:hypothetical protein
MFEIRTRRRVVNRLGALVFFIFIGEDPLPGTPEQNDAPVRASELKTNACRAVRP